MLTVNDIMYSVHLFLMELHSIEFISTSLVPSIFVIHSSAGLRSVELRSTNLSSTNLFLHLHIL